MSFRSSRSAPGGGGVDEDPVGLGLEFLVVDPAGPPGDLPRPRDREAAGRGGGVQQRMPSQQAHLPDGGLGVPAAEVVLGGQPGGAAGVPVGVVVVAGVEPAQEPVLRGPEQRGDRPEGLQGLPAGRALEVAGGGGVQVRAEGAADAERVRDAGEAPAGCGQGATRTVCRAHHQPPPPRSRACDWLPVPRRLVGSAAIADASATSYSRWAACLSLQITRSTDDNQIKSR